jgi:hypothetical protein
MGTEPRAASALTQAGLIAAGALREGDRGTISPGPDLKNKS